LALVNSNRSIDAYIGHHNATEQMQVTSTRPISVDEWQHYNILLPTIVTWSISTRNCLMPCQRVFCSCINSSDLQDKSNQNADFLFEKSQVQVMSRSAQL